MRAWTAQIGKTRPARRRTWLLAGAALVLPLVPGCSPGAGEIGEGLPVAVGVTVVAREEIGRQLRYSATVKEWQKVDLSFKVAGTVARLHQARGADGTERDVQSGDRVPAGTVIARLDDADYRRRWEIAREQLARAEHEVTASRAGAEAASKDHGRIVRLHQQRVATQEQLDTTRSRRDSTRAAALAMERGVKAARIALEQAKDDLDNCALLVPPMGCATVAERYVETNERVGVAQRAFLMIDVAKVRVAFGVPDLLVAALEPGRDLAVTCEAMPGRTFVGRVSKIAAAADPGTRTFPVEVTIEKPDGLRPGMVVTVAVGQRKEGILLPLTAVQRGTTKHDFVVYLVLPEHDRKVARRRRVRFDGVYDNRLLVDGPASEIRPDDRVVVSGASRLVDGQAVRVVEERRGTPEILP